MIVIKILAVIGALSLVRLGALLFAVWDSKFENIVKYIINNIKSINKKE